MDAVQVGPGQAAVVHPGQLGNAVHQFGDFRAELAAQVGHGDAAILDDIVEQGAANGVAVQIQVGQKGGGGQGMGNVRLAGLAVLPVVAAVGIGIRLLHQLHRFGGQVAGYLSDQALGVGRFYPILHNSYGAGCVGVRNIMVCCNNTAELPECLGLGLAALGQNRSILSRSS